MSQKAGIGLEVLVIDDEEKDKDKMMLRRILEALGFIVVWQPSWLKTQQFLRKRHRDRHPFPDLALVDAHFFPPFLDITTVPDDEGREIIRKIEEECVELERPVIPRIAFSHKFGSEKREELIQAGACEFIGLPVSQDPDETRVLLVKLLEAMNEAPDTQLWGWGAT